MVLAENELGHIRKDRDQIVRFILFKQTADFIQCAVRVDAIDAVHDQGRLGNTGHSPDRSGSVAGGRQFRPHLGALFLEHFQDAFPAVPFGRCEDLLYKADRLAKVLM